MKKLKRSGKKYRIMLLLLSMVFMYSYVFDCGCFMKYGYALIKKEEDLSAADKNTIYEARRALLLKDYNKVEYNYRKILERHPDVFAVRLELANFYVEQNEWDKAIDEYRELIFLKPGNLNLRLRYIKILIWAKRYQEAEQELQRMYKGYPENEEIIEDLITVYTEKKQWGKAEQLLGKLTEKNPYYVKYHLESGKVLSWDKKYPEALAEFNKVLELDPGNFEARKNIAYIHSYQNQWDKAEKEFKDLIKERPDDHELKQELGDIYFYQDRYSDAGIIYDQLLSVNPELARSIGSRISDISILSGPQLSYNFFYYHEQKRNTNISAENHQHLVEYSWGLTKKMQALLFLGWRHDRVVGDSVISGGGLQYAFSPNFLIEPRVSFEPDHELNPRYKGRLSATIIPHDNFAVVVFDEYTRYWDENRSNSCGMQTTGFFMNNRSLRLRYGLFYDWIRWPSDYFVRIDKPAGSRLDLWTNMVTVEKDILWRRLILTPGYTFSYDSTARKSHTVFGNLSFIYQELNFVFSASLGKDSDDYIYKTAGFYVSHRF